MTLLIKNISILFTAGITFALLGYMTIQANSFAIYEDVINERDANWKTGVENIDNESKENKGFDDSSVIIKTNEGNKTFPASEINNKKITASNESYVTVDVIHDIDFTPAKEDRRGKRYARVDADTKDKNSTISKIDVVAKKNKKSNVPIDGKKKENGVADSENKKGKTKIKRQKESQDRKSSYFGIKNKTVRNLSDVIANLLKQKNNTNEKVDYNWQEKVNIKDTGKYKVKSVNYGKYSVKESNGNKTRTKSISARMANDQLESNSTPDPLVTHAASTMTFTKVTSRRTSTTTATTVVLTADAGSPPYSLITKSDGAQATSVYYEPPKDPQPENFGGPFTLHTDLAGGQVISSPLKP